MSLCCSPGGTRFPAPHTRPTALRPLAAAAVGTARDLRAAPRGHLSMSRTTRAPTAPPRRRPTMVKLYALLAAPAAALVAKTNPLPRAARARRAGRRRDEVPRGGHRRRPVRRLRRRDLRPGAEHRDVHHRAQDGQRQAVRRGDPPVHGRRVRPAVRDHRPQGPQDEDDLAVERRGRHRLHAQGRRVHRHVPARGHGRLPAGPRRQAGRRAHQRARDVDRLPGAGRRQRGDTRSTTRATTSAARRPTRRSTWT